MDGICTLANDRVYDQLVALLNSIEAVQGSQMPVCVFPYDENVDRVAAEIARRPNVQLYDDTESIRRWETFAEEIWKTHPTAFQRWNLQPGERFNRVGMHRRFCGFDGPFDRFIYMDGDTLLMDSVDFIFEKLETYDCVVYDFQYKDPSHVYDVTSEKLYDIFPKERIESEIFCAGFYGTKKGLFDEEARKELLEYLKSDEADILYVNGPDQSIVNYMMMRSHKSVYNFAHHRSDDEKTGCCVTSPHFENRNNVLYDKGRRLTYLHYIGIPLNAFSRVCTGENVEFPYRDLFLHYRYLHEPEKRPKLTGKPKPYNPKPTLTQRILKKLNLTR
ncbi:Methionine synthase II (cobalamin-independent) [Geitlerinema sp. FC II]|nr:sugar transferase [Geitlerinema sp. CS-897]PPT09448.1 Methionine synthase II (cobalamin-independent) [Geitlerinema sp. FC II]